MITLTPEQILISDGNVFIAIFQKEVGYSRFDEWLVTHLYFREGMVINQELIDELRPNRPLKILGIHVDTIEVFGQDTEKSFPVPKEIFDILVEDGNIVLYERSQANRSDDEFAILLDQKSLMLH